MLSGLASSLIALERKLGKHEEQLDGGHCIVSKEAFPSTKENEAGYGGPLLLTPFPKRHVQPGLELKAQLW